MKVILADEQVQEIRQLLSNLIEEEIQNKLNKSNLNSPYLNKKQTCDYLGISNNTLDSWIRQGLPTIRIGKTVRFDKDDIHKWLKKQ